MPNEDPEHGGHVDRDHRDDQRVQHDHRDDHRHHRRHDHGHHGHQNDQGIRGALRYLRWLPQMLRSTINDRVVDLVDPKPGERVIDIGAGMGAGAMRAAATGAHVIAVEPTPLMRRILTIRRTFSRRHRRVEVVAGAAEQIPAADRSADAIWAVNTMHHWVDLGRGVAEIARVLRPNGRIVLVDEVFTDPSHPDHERFGGDHDDEHHGFTLVDADQICELLREAGLIDVDGSNRRIADRPVIAITAVGGPTTGRPVTF